MDDRQIIELFLQRNESAVTEAAKKYEGYCRAVAVRILQSPEDIEEALNDTWLAAWNCIPPHEPECLQTFLGRLTRNICLKQCRAQQAQKRGADELCVVFEELEGCLSSGQDVEREISAKELADSINRFLGGLPDSERQVFVRRYWYMQPVAEIADACDFSQSKVKTMLHRLRKRLAAKLKKEGFL